MSNEKVIYCIILTITLLILIDCDSKEKEKNNSVMEEIRRVKAALANN